MSANKRQDTMASFSSSHRLNIGETAQIPIERYHTLDVDHDDLGRDRAM